MVVILGHIVTTERTMSERPMWSLGWRLEKIAKDIDGELKFYECSDRDQTYKKIVIEYGKEKKQCKQ